MGATMTQKILARVSGHDAAHPLPPGQIIWASPDLVSAPEVSFSAYIKRLRDIGVTRLAQPDKVAVIIDHEVPVHSAAGAERNQLTRKLAQELSVGHFFDGVGITHPLLVERGLVRPGMFAAGADSHAPALGAVGALSIPFGFEVTMVLATGQIWLQVPETIRVRLHGCCPPGVAARDIVLATMQQLDDDLTSYRVIEYQGEGLASLSIPERMTICGLCVDAGAKSGIAQVDQRCVEALHALGVADAAFFHSDADASYAHTIDIDLDSLSPRVSIPPSPSHVREAQALSAIRIDHAYIGSCASGSIEDLRAAAAILRGHKVHPAVRLLVIPATQRVFQQALEEGLLTELSAAGAQISPSTCGPCFGGMAQLTAGERRISTSTRNDPGRMGSNAAEIYLASAMTVAASAITGHITDPRQFVDSVAVAGSAT
ncbi:3-isopropylmalate/(R)-2-methylmalate dehydratase large subunit [Herbaspirillum sp. Sphag1AN]|uniref:3-isopropylmalate dehydratase large subunit n=1 Tax=unclassified Herbaspirillum TaxID=2624150 RepID=UPI00161025A1|nr:MULTISPECIES: aconitase/3-isopropylmalate dehydratase large subunit family protein [unclassified Herbaspirillum]MBB3212936.1 3-isopropylmalate/(R)-2-methylmalate dehydratase large subunit [Herbaspirillum sp. Sphag1AN]MBB3246133.1 3-isopropylmalate/(R)-2-methylmalate dehydratase large subunit [Herbaspirillum sp. Sphag64]